jgi:hypothetical protein
MTTTDVQAAMARLRELGPGPVSLVQRGGEPFPATFALAPPISWDRHELETGIGATIPPDLGTFWDCAGGARLFVDAEYGQWGLALWSAADVKTHSPAELAKRPNDCISGDVFVGKFIGDQDRLLVRCKSGQPDFGQVFVALPIDPRALWPVVAESLGEFLMKYVEASGDKYWS